MSSFMDDKEPTTYIYHAFSYVDYCNTGTVNIYSLDFDTDFSTNNSYLFPDN